MYIWVNKYPFMCLQICLLKMESILKRIFVSVTLHRILAQSRGILRMHSFEYTSFKYASGLFDQPFEAD